VEKQIVLKIFGWIGRAFLSFGLVLGGVIIRVRKPFLPGKELFLPFLKKPKEGYSNQRGKGSRLSKEATMEGGIKAQPMGREFSNSRKPGQKSYLKGRRLKVLNLYSSLILIIGFYRPFPGLKLMPKV